MNVVFPLIAVVTAAVFATQLGRQWAARRRSHALAWCISIALFGTGHVAVAVALLLHWTPAVFGVYWLAGALLNVPYLALGQLLLLDRQRFWNVLWWTIAGLATLWCVIFTVTATYDAAALDAANAAGAIPLGEDVLGGTVAYALLRPMTYTFVIVVAGCIWSAVKTRRWGVLLIALGVLIAASGSATIRVGGGELFPILSSAGIVVMYLGFRAASRVPVAKPVPAGVAPA